MGMPHPTNNHAPLPSFLELSLEDAKGEDVQRPLWPPNDLHRPELTTEPFSRLRDEPASMLDGPFLGRGRVGKQKNLRRNASSSFEVLPRFIKIATNESFM